MRIQEGSIWIIINPVIGWNIQYRAGWGAVVNTYNIAFGVYTGIYKSINYLMLKQVVGMF